MEFKAEEWTDMMYPIKVRIANQRKKWDDHERLGLPAPFTAVVSLDATCKQAECTWERAPTTRILNTLNRTGIKNHITRWQKLVNDLKPLGLNESLNEHELKSWKDHAWFLANLYAATVYYEQMDSMAALEYEINNVHSTPTPAGQSETWVFRTETAAQTYSLTPRAGHSDVAHASVAASEKQMSATRTPGVVPNEDARDRDDMVVTISVPERTNRIIQMRNPGPLMPLQLAPLRSDVSPTWDFEGQEARLEQVKAVRREIETEKAREFGRWEKAIIDRFLRHARGELVETDPVGIEDDTEEQKGVAMLYPPPRKNFAVQYAPQLWRAASDDTDILMDDDGDCTDQSSHSTTDVRAATRSGRDDGRMQSYQSSDNYLEHGSTPSALQDHPLVTPSIDANGRNHVRANSGKFVNKVALAGVERLDEAVRKSTRLAKKPASPIDDDVIFVTRESRSANSVAKAKASGGDSTCSPATIPGDKDDTDIGNKDVETDTTPLLDAIGRSHLRGKGGIFVSKDGTSKRTKSQMGLNQREC